MKNKTAAVAGMFPPDLRSPVPLSPQEMGLVRAAKHEPEHERAKIHRLLLTESMRRLRAGRTLEREHGVIHPEMTCIVRDVLRLTDLVFPSASPSTSHDDTDEGGASDAGSDARQLAELLK